MTAKIYERPKREPEAAKEPARDAEAERQAKAAQEAAAEHDRKVRAMVLAVRRSIASIRNTENY